MTKFVPATSFPFEERPDGARDWGGDPRRAGPVSLRDQLRLQRGQIVRSRGATTQYVAAFSYAPGPAPASIEVFMGHPSDSSPQEIVVSWNQAKANPSRSSQWVDIDVFQKGRSGSPDRPVFRTIRQYEAQTRVTRLIDIAGMPIGRVGGGSPRSVLVNQPLYCRISNVNKLSSPAWWDDPALTIAVTVKLLQETVR
jgi:hypothetical protein